MWFEACCLPLQRKYTWTMAWKKSAMLADSDIFVSELYFFKILPICMVLYVCFFYTNKKHNTFWADETSTQIWTAGGSFQSSLLLFTLTARNMKSQTVKKIKHFKWVERVRCVYMFQRNQKDSHVWTKHIEFRHNMP